jgi:hypothetical protein
MKKLRKDKHCSLFSIAGASSISLLVLDVDSIPQPLDYEANVLPPVLPPHWLEHPIVTPIGWLLSLPNKKKMNTLAYFSTAISDEEKKFYIRLTPVHKRPEVSDRWRGRQTRPSSSRSWGWCRRRRSAASTRFERRSSAGSGRPRTTRWSTAIGCRAARAEMGNTLMQGPLTEGEWSGQLTSSLR